MAVRFAENMTLGHTDMDEDDIRRMRVHYDDDQIVEIACVVGLFSYLNRFAETMGVWPTRPGEGGPDDDGA